MFKKKKLYKIVYEKANTYTVIMEAKDEYQAIKRFYRKYGDGITPSIISFEEYELVNKRCV